jgi:hypothetical protein
VPPGYRQAVLALTNRPVDAERATERVLRVVPPTRSVVVRPGCRRAVLLFTNLL